MATYRVRIEHLLVYEDEYDGNETTATDAAWAAYEKDDMPMVWDDIYIVDVEEL